MTHTQKISIDLVSNLEMPWSGNRNYDVLVSKGEAEVEAAVADLRGKGAKKVFVAGHSQGGAFALHLAGRMSVDGIICMNMDRAARAAKAQTPILWMNARNDYLGLRKANPALFRALPSNPLTRQYEADSDHRGAPTASADEIVRWTREVAGAPKP